jgi:protein-disulfide isomerase
MLKKRWITMLVLLALPVAAVQLVKRTDWGPMLATPKTRQTGDPKAKVVIIEYSDFQCPSCASIQPTVQKMLEIYRGKIRLFFKYYPLTKIHKNALPAAQAAECAAEQDKFWPYQERLFASQNAWVPLTEATTSFVAIAQEVQLDMTRFNRCLADPAKRASIERDSQEALNRQIQATPTFFIGEERLVGNVFATDGARAIEKALRQ